MTKIPRQLRPANKNAEVTCLTIQSQEFYVLFYLFFAGVATIKIIMQVSLCSGCGSVHVDMYNLFAERKPGFPLPNGGG